MFTKTKKVLISGFMVVSLACTSIPNVSAADNNVNTNEDIRTDYLKVMYDEKVLYHELVPLKTIIQVLDTSDNVIMSEVFKSEKDFILKDPQLELGEFLSYWQIENLGDKFVIKPIVDKVKQFDIKFNSLAGGYLLKDNSQMTYIKKSVNKNTTLEDIMPAVTNKDYMKFRGWYEKTSNRKKEEYVKVDDLNQKVTTNKEYYAMFYDDYNDNEVDDKTEKITVNFVTKTKDKMKSVKTTVGETLKLPKLKKDNYIFLGWYSDKKMKNEITSNTRLTSDLTLYAKFKKMKSVIEESEDEPIRDEDISNQIEENLNGGSSNNEKPNKVENEKPSKSEVVKPNKSENEKPSKSEVVKPNKSENEKPSKSEVVKPVENVTEIATDNINPNLTSEPKKVYENKNIDEKFVIKFIDENGAFIFSLVLPYGRTITLLDDNKNFKKEYSVRQNTTIQINTTEYVTNKGSIFLDLQSSNKEVNATKVTEIFPEVATQTSGNLSYQKKEPKKQSFLLDNALLLSMICLILSAIVGAVLLWRNKKKKNKDLQSSL